MLTITRKLEIDAGHRLINHESKCAHLHGHRYRFDVTVTASDLDEVGRVIDFAKVKELVGGWLDEHWDHGFIVQEGDPLIQWLIAHGQKHRVLKMPPTAENLVRLAGEAAQEVLRPHNIQVVEVVCWETPNCWAKWRCYP